MALGIALLLFALLMPPNYPPGRSYSERRPIPAHRVGLL